MTHVCVCDDHMDNRQFISRLGFLRFFVYSQILDRKYSAEKALTTCFCASFLMLLLGMTR